MPVVFRQNGFRFHFFSDEGSPLEPVHIHIRKAGDNAKFWLYPEVHLAYNVGFNAKTLAELEKIVAQHVPEIEERGMTTSPRAKEVRFDDYMMWLDLDDSRTLGIPLAWYPRLLHGAPELREKVEISAMGLHWEELDEDISIAGLIAGRADRTKAGKRAA